MTGNFNSKSHGLGGSGEKKNKKETNQLNANLTNKKKDLLTKSRNKKKKQKDIPTITTTTTTIIDKDLPESIKKYPVNFSSIVQNKIYVSLNNHNRLEGARRDCEIDECYREIKYKLNDDMRFVGSIILGMVNRYVTDYSNKAKLSNHLGQIEETFEILNDFGYNLGFYKDGLIPLVLKNMNPGLFLEQNNNKEGEVLPVRKIL